MTTTTSATTTTTAAIKTTKTMTTTTTTINYKDKAQALKAKKNMEPTKSKDGTLKFIFMNRKRTPEGSFGMFSFDNKYKNLVGPGTGTDVEVDMEIFTVTNVDSLEKTIGIELKLHIAWEDVRIEWTDYPESNEEWEFETDVLK